MPATPSAKLLASIDGGAPQSGGIIAANEATVQFSAESTVGWDLTTPPRWEIFAFPPGWTGPASGWSTESVPQPGGGSADIYVYIGLGPPPAFDLPALPMWGDFLCKLTVQGGLSNGVPDANLIDDRTALRIVSPGGLTDVAVSDTGQFDPARSWVGSLQDDLRVLDGVIGSMTPFIGTPSPIVFGAANAGIDTAYARGDHDHELTFATWNVVAAAANSPIDVNGQTVTGGGFIAPYFATSSGNPAQSGLLRGAHATVIVAARASSTLEDVPLVSYGTDATDHLTIGDAVVPCMRFVIASGCDFQFYHDADLLYTLGQNTITIGATNIFSISHTVGTGAGQDATIEAQPGAGGFAGATLKLKSGTAGAGSTPGNVEVDTKASATASGSFVVKATGFGEMARISYDHPTTTTTLAMGPLDARIAANTLRLDADNVAIFTDAGSFGGGTGVVHLKDATVAPAGDNDKGVQIWGTPGGSTLNVRNHALTVLAAEVQNAPTNEDLRSPDIRQARLTTTDATTTQLLSFTVPDDAVVKVTMEVEMWSPDGGKSAGYERKAVFKRFSGGAVTQVGTTVTVLEEEDDVATDASFGAGATTFTVSVTGLSATICHWFGSVTVRLMQPA